MTPTTPADAKALGLSRYFTGRPCKHGHVAERRARDRSCVDCDAVKCRRHYEANTEQYLERQRARQAANREEVRAASNRWKSKNREQVRAYAAAYREANAAVLDAASRERRKANPEKTREWQRNWVSQNRGRKNALTAARMSHVKRATPPWLTEEDRASIREMYEEAARLTKKTGIPHQVDHVIPLRGKYISGLHVPGNLQILTASENSRKRNSYDTRINPNP